MGRKRSKYYINPDELKEEISKFQSGKDDIMSDKLGEMLIKLAERFASLPNFSGYSYKEDFIGDAIYRMIQQIDKINLDHPKCNCFSYLTQICYHVYIAKIKKEKKYSETKELLKEEYFNDLETAEIIHFKKNP